MDQKEWPGEIYIPVAYAEKQPDGTYQMQPEVTPVSKETIPTIVSDMYNTFDMIFIELKEFGMNYTVLKGLK